MKLTESQLRKIIREELKAVRADQLHLTEGDFVTSSAEPDPASAAPGAREAKTPTAAELAEKDGYYYPPAGKVTDLAMKMAKARGLKIADRDMQLKYFKKARELAGAPAGPMEESPLQEDGHTDVASARRMMRTICHNSGVILETLKTMPGEDPLPSWWTNKSAVVADKIQGMRDYLVVSSDE